MDCLDCDKEDKIINKTEIIGLSSDYKDYKQIIHLPDNTVSNRPIEEEIEIFVDECQDNLKYYISSDIDIIHKILKIFVLPIVESA